MKTPIGQNGPKTTSAPTDQPLKVSQTRPITGYLWPKGMEELNKSKLNISFLMFWNPKVSVFLLSSTLMKSPSASSNVKL